MSNFFTNKTFVFTGELSMDRNYAKSKVILLGGKVTVAPSGKTDYLIVGSEPGPSKLKKAKDLNIKILYEEEFTKLINEGIKADDISVNIDRPAGMTSNDTIEIENNEDDTDVIQINVNKNNQMWSEKYRPGTRQELIGNPGIISSLYDFLNGKTKFKAALLSGSPGLGKTTSVQVLCKEMNYELIEYNASDVRSKSQIIAQIKNILNTQCLSRSFKLKKKVVLMDEIDGMTSDRGGLVELNNIIKTSSVPIICICNDRNNIKIRTLANNCLDLRFRKLDARQILPKLKEILKKEQKNISENILNEIILMGNGDMRYILNTLQNICLKHSVNFKTATDVVRKDIQKNIFEVASETFHKSSINEKVNLYFEDYSIIPLFISENYFKCNFKSFADLYESSDAISQGDIIENLIRGSNQEWGLAPLHGFFSVALPTRNKSLTKRIDFPGWLGQNSKQQKIMNYMKLISMHTFRKIKSSIENIRMYDLNIIYAHYTNHLVNVRVKEALDILLEFDLLKEDMDYLPEILINGNTLVKGIKAKTKMELTKTYNKIKRNLPYLVEDTKKSKSEIVAEEEESFLN